MAVIRTERGLDRLVNFSDAAVAIAITILILPLVDLAADLGKYPSFARFAGDNYSAFIAFGVTFAVTGQFWVVHHRVFEWVDDYSAGLIWLNFLWLASIVFLPFAANVLASLGRVDAGVYVLYVSTMLVSSLSMLLMELHLRAHPELLRPEGEGQLTTTRSITFAGLLVVILVLVAAVPRVGMYWLLLLLLLFPIYAILQRRTRHDRGTGAQ